LNALVKITVAFLAQCGRTALHSVDFYVLTSRNIFETHFCFLPPEGFGVFGLLFSPGGPPLPPNS
jgi:hypothetical protein